MLTKTLIFYSGEQSQLGPFCKLGKTLTFHLGEQNQLGHSASWTKRQHFTRESKVSSALLQVGQNTNISLGNGRISLALLQVGQNANILHGRTKSARPFCKLGKTPTFHLGEQNQLGPSASWTKRQHFTRASKINSALMQVGQYTNCLYGLCQAIVGFLPLAFIVAQYPCDVIVQKHII
ncbi:unnamed protein product [Camellia sinensis]